MADNDPYGLFGDDAATAPRKRTRSRTRARDVEQPSADQKVEDAEPADPYGLFAGEDEPATAPDADLKRGPAPGPAGSPSPRGGREHESAWYEPLLESVGSFAQGGALNLGDEAAGAARWALGKSGLMRDVGSLEENMDVMKSDADRVTRAYPYGHGAGQMATGMAASAGVPSVAGQAALQGILSGGSEYADSRSGWRAAGQGALGAAAGGVGAWGANKVANLLATSPKAATEAELRAIERASSSRPPAPPAQWPPAHPGVAPEAGPPRPLPVPDGGGGVPPDAVAKLLRGSNGKFQKVLPMELDATPAPKPSAPPVEASYEPPAGDWTSELLSPAPRAPSLPEASERELQQLALSRAAQNMPPDKLGDGLKSLSNGAAMLGQGQAAMMLRGGALASKLLRPGVREGAIAQGELVPNEAAGAAWRMGSEAAWELGAPAVHGGKVNAQDGDPAAMRAAEGWAPTRLSPAEEAKFKQDMLSGDGYRQWREEFEKQWDTKVNFDDPTSDYDYRGAWKAGIRPSRYQYDDDKYHWASSTPDGRMLKAPDHPTAWMEHFMRRTGVDPGALGLKNDVQGAQWEREQTAYATGPTLHYALSATLHAGRTGLPPADEQALTSAVVSGDDKAIAAIDFRLKQKYPAYARQVERQLRDLNEGDD